MNNNTTQVKQMMDAIMKIESEFMKDKISQDSVAKKNTINAILEELEKVMADEN